MQISPTVKSWVEFIEKTLVIVTLLISLGASAYHGVAFLSAKRQQAIALTEETNKRREILDRFADVYLEQLDIINADIRNLDEDLEQEVWKNTTGWDVKIAIRAEKSKDRLEILRNMGSRILELKKLDISE